jgi:hypothetical protein
MTGEMPKDFMASTSLDELTNHNGELILLFVESLAFSKALSEFGVK